MFDENVTATFLVHHVSPGPGGGCVFFGKDGSGQDISASIDYKWKGRLPKTNEVWRVEGVRKPHPKHPKTIRAKNATPVVPPVGDLTRRFLLEADQFRHFGFGEGKLDRLEKGLAAEGVTVRDALNERQIELMSNHLPVGMVENLIEAWRLSIRDCEIYEFLDEHGFDRALAATVRRVFKENVVAKLKDNPYRLLAFGTPEMEMWKKAEVAASLLGIDRNDPKRLAAAVEQAFYDRLEEGHTLVGLDELRESVMGLLKTKSDKVFEAAIRAAADQKLVVRCDDGLQALGPASMEERVERKLAALASLDADACQPSLYSVDDERLEELLSEVDAKFADKYEGHLNPEQLNAVRVIYTSFLSVVTGGAGTGKTTILRAVHDIAERTGRTVYQMALSGRAKVRLEEATDRRAFTVRAFIERLKKGQETPGSKDAVVVEEGSHIIIDEASMVDLALLHKLLSLLPNKVRLSMVGDPGQLPPPSFGIIFHLMVGVPGIRTVELKEIVRQEDITGIPGLSQSVRSGKVPELSVFRCVDSFPGPVDGVSFVAVTDKEDMTAVLFEISRKLGHECQVLCVRRRNGNDSSNQVNNFFQYRRSDAQHCEQLARWKMFVGDPVIVTRNSYELGLFNGELGELIGVAGHLAIFRFGKTVHELNDEQMVEAGIGLAYGITVHKAQGSEFDRVVVPVSPSRGLDRSLIYTAITRAKKQVVFIGFKGAFDKAVEDEPKVASVSVGFDLRAALAARRTR